MTLFEKILVPLDGSEHSINALEKAIQIAKKFDGKITLIHAYSTDLVPLPKEYAVTEAAPELVEVSRYKGASILTEAQIRAKDQGVQVETLLKAGQAVENIVETSRNGDFDLIVMGARGLSPIKEILLGSVSHGVTTHAPCPILVVK
jgi:nucleotide-binding universal stress UspA family protein